MRDRYCHVPSVKRTELILSCEVVLFVTLHLCNGKSNRTLLREKSHLLGEKVGRISSFLISNLCLNTIYSHSTDDMVGGLDIFKLKP